ncbi:MAG: bifunctional GNAT family N-acetyltransferase/carbon-nitrogen hydrolase family protein [Prolixibacteraceae bacterium]|nr:bifunctional GNAT family N-acetyltransferase/carbon-nitrogen hydrolase family protein [Prolixibacteraceae bacterium]
MMIKVEKVELRNLKISDYRELKNSMIKAYSNLDGMYWKEHHINTLLKKFPEGQVCILVNDRVVGSALSIIVDYEQFNDEHTFLDITGDYKFNTHNPDGNVLYGIEVFIHPEYRGLRLGRRLYDYRKDLCEKLNLEGIVFGGRMPNYAKYSNEYTPKEYIQKVKAKKIHDPVLNFQLSNDFHVKKVLKNYLPGDIESKDYAVLLEWDNIYYEKPKPIVKQIKSVVRMGLVQWQMRPYKTVEDVFEQIEFFVDAVSGYRADFVLFPEFFNAPLMAHHNHLSEAGAIRELAKTTDVLREKFIELAISYNINIITGSMPAVENDKLYNVGYLCKRNGQFEKYIKLHVTPDESKVWGMTGGDIIKTYDTDCGKIGILICYDVEFPELGRILADQGMNILFVPFLTDTQNGYSRVRNCAQARAIENECYVAIAGSVGNLPKVKNMDIQFAQSMVFSPCDFAFPTNGIKAEATPNTEMILIADVDLSLINELHNFGSVRNLKDRRKDIFELILKK